MRAQAAALATPCWPASVSAITRRAPGALRHQRLAECIVDLSARPCARGLALEPDFGIQACGKSPAARERGRPPGEVAQLPRELTAKCSVAQQPRRPFRQPLERRHQRPGTYAAPNGPKRPRASGSSPVSAAARSCSRSPVMGRALTRRRRARGGDERRIRIGSFTPGAYSNAARDVDAEWPSPSRSPQRHSPRRVRRRGSPDRRASIAAARQSARRPCPPPGASNTKRPAAPAPPSRHRAGRASIRSPAAAGCARSPRRPSAAASGWNARARDAQAPVPMPRHRDCEHSPGSVAASRLAPRREVAKRREVKHEADRVGTRRDCGIKGRLVRHAADLNEDAHAAARPAASMRRTASSGSGAVISAPPTSAIR